jgi:hypothetical protein
MTDEARVHEILDALIAEYGEPEVWDEATAMLFVRYAYGQGYIEAQFARTESVA